MKYPACSNGNCMHNDKYLCKAEGSDFDQDIICKQGKADGIEKIRMIEPKFVFTRGRK